MFAIACKQTNNNEGQKLDNPATSNEIAIKVKGDEGVKIKEPASFKVKKSSTWKDIKQEAIDKITPKENKEIKEWGLKDEKGAVLQEGTTFEKDETVFAITKDKEKPEPPVTSITITIEIDSGYTFKENKTPCTMEVEKNSTWSNTKEKAKAKIELKKGYEEAGWKLNGKDGTSLEDTHIFDSNTTIYATSIGEQEVQDTEKPIVDGKEGEEDAKIKLVKVKEEDGKETEKVKISGNISSVDINQVLEALKREEYKDKAITTTSTLNIEFNNEESTINKENFDTLAEKMKGASIKIENGKNIELDNNINITTLKGTVRLANIATEDININTELKREEFIGYKIQKQTKGINSDALIIKTTDEETFSKTNLEKIAKTLTKTNIKEASQNITLDTSAKLTSVSGKITLADIAAKGAATGKVNVAGFIADKIQTQEGPITSDNLNITTNDTETFLRKR